MKEIEKMLKKEWYDANFDEELLAMRQKAELNCFDLICLSREVMNSFLH